MLSVNVSLLMGARLCWMISSRSSDTVRMIVRDFTSWIVFTLGMGLCPRAAARRET
jgi:hypothetical protein